MRTIGPATSWENMDTFQENSQKFLVGWIVPR
jgi:hypothetical protein